MHTNTWVVCNSWSVVATVGKAERASRAKADEGRWKASLPSIWRPMGITIGLCLKRDPDSVPRSRRKTLSPQNPWLHQKIFLNANANENSENQGLGEILRFSVLWVCSVQKVKTSPSIGTLGTCLSTYSTVYLFLWLALSHSLSLQQTISIVVNELYLFF